MVKGFAAGLLVCAAYIHRRDLQREWIWAKRDIAELGRVLTANKVRLARR